MTVYTRLRGLAAAFMVFCFSSCLLAQASAAAGLISGSVSNLSAKSLLEGARVEIAALGISTTTDNTGYYSLVDIPPGDYTVEASYMGLDSQSRTVRIAAGQRVEISFELVSEVYTLSQFQVTTEREGNAASITRQRNAPNVKSVVALDAFGRLSNDNAGELLIRLPGIGGRLDDEGNITGAMVRGTAVGLNTVSVDGSLQASTGGMARDFRTHAISGALFDEIEVSKAPTPDMPADSLGGAINFRTRSVLNMREKRRLSYRASARWAPSFFDNVPLREGHRMHPLLNLSYQEVFDVLGQSRNLGVSLDAFYSENVSSYFKMIQDYEYSVKSPAYVWDYRTTDGYNNRKQKSVNLKTEYKLGPNTRIHFNTIVNDAFEPYNNLYTTRAYTGRTVGTTGTSAILPTYTDDVTEVRPVSGSNFQLNSTRYSFVTRERQFNVGVRHNTDRIQLDAGVNYNYSHPNLGNGRTPETSGGIFTANVQGLGWILDKSKDEIYPKFTQTAGADIRNIANYKNGLITTRDGKRNTDVFNAAVNLRYVVPSDIKITLKSGLNFRSQKFVVVGNDRQWNFVGASLSDYVDSSIRTSSEERVGYDLPFVNTIWVGDAIRKGSTDWKENLYYANSERLIDAMRVNEDVAAAYFQAQIGVGRLNALVGIRGERTETESSGNVASKTLSTTAERTADPIGAALRDYNNPLNNEGGYTDWFPGIHLTYKILPNFQARFSWSNSVGRPTANNYVPTRSISDTNQTITRSNPSLLPQHASNADISLEYYFEPVGQLSVGFFQKRISDFIVNNAFSGIVGSGPDNGFNGNYEGYSLLTTLNGGFAKIQGWEANYQQQFSFLPGVLKGLGFFANYTKLTTEGDYGDAGGNLSTNQVANFVPETANAGLSFNYRSFSSRLLLNYTGDYLSNYSTDPSRLQYRDSRTIVNLNLSYRLHRDLSVFCDISNLFNEPQRLYRYSSDRVSALTYNYTTLTLGVSGRF